MKLPVNYENLHWTQRKAVRLEYIRLQKNLCCHCGNDLAGEPCDNVVAKKVDNTLFPSGFFTYPVHLHHNHKTGMTIGAIHSRCNAVLWQYHGE